MADKMLTLDGSYGEGGGQILRTSLALALITGRGFHLHNLRAKRKNPGLARQHMACLQAAAILGEAETQGVNLGSQEIVFCPRRPMAHIAAGAEWHFEVPSAGSAMLLLQTLLFPLAQRGGRLRVKGGTHNPMAPPFDFLTNTFFPLLARMGLTADAELIRPGFCPAGGGEAVFVIAPCLRPSPLALLQRGKVRNIRAVAYISRLPAHIAGRELAVIGKRLDISPENLRTVVARDAAGAGNVAAVFLDCEEVSETFTAFGVKGVRAEKVGLAAANEAQQWLKADVPVGPYLADQLLLPCALAGGGEFRTMAPTAHSRTNAWVISKFLDIKTEFIPQADGSWLVRVKTVAAN